MPRFRAGDALLAALAPKIATAAQAVVDAWDQDASGESAEYGCGGVCDDVAEAIASVIDAAGHEATTRHDESENHTAAYARLPDGVYYVDVRQGAYERKISHYVYRKIEGAQIEPGDVVWERVFGEEESDERWAEIEEGW